MTKIRRVVKTQYYSYRTEKGEFRHKTKYLRTVYVYQFPRVDVSDLAGVEMTCKRRGYVITLQPKKKIFP